uniref:Tetraspanin n=1 Tax=Meloidogyne hapla TaxID=6305 RepID=A0A1I8BG81_MELHA
MRVVPPVSNCLQNSLYFSNFLLWASGFVLLSISLWLLFDPAQNFQLELLHFSENAPLLKFGIYLMAGTALLMLFVGSIGCFGAVKLERFLLGSFILLLLIALLAKLGVVVLCILHQTKHHCCGGYNFSEYSDSFWYLTNTERGTRSYVPRSCCRQSQEGRAWAIQPIDPLCIQYFPGSRAFNNSVNIQGCGLPTKKHLDWQIQILLLSCVLCSLVDHEAGEKREKKRKHHF